MREPRRKLHQDHCGKAGQLVLAPEELRPKKKAKIVTDFNLEMARGSRTIKNGNGTMVEERNSCGKTPVYRATQPSVLNFAPPVPAASTEQSQDGLSGLFPAFEMDNQEVNNPFRNTIAPLMSYRRASLPNLFSSPFAQHMILSQSLPVPMTPIRRHPNKPQNISQKRYKGAQSDTESGLSLKRRRIDMELASLGSTPENQCSASTRTRRSASSPVMPSPDSIRLHQAVMRV